MIDEMTGLEAELFLRRAALCIQGIPGVPDKINFSKKIHIMNGKTDDDFYGVTYHVGIKDFSENPTGKFSRAQVAGAVIALFHEVCGHGGQIYGEFNKSDSDLSKVLALNYYACKGSSYYHGAVDTNEGEVIFPHYLGILMR